jgi:2-(1,2-epoxy-1,2-dihydrophenyl)acetyl-CoA isomerase
LAERVVTTDSVLSEVDGVRIEVRGDRVDVVLAAKPGNPIDVSLARSLRSAIGLVARRDPRVVVIRAEGADFSFGGDLAAFRSADSYPDYVDEVLESFHEAVDLLYEMDAPTLCAVRGWVAGGALGLVTACDLVVSSSDARFKYPYQRLGLTPDGGSVWHLARVIGPARTLSLLATDAALDAEEALATGVLVSEVVAPGELDQVVATRANQLATVSPAVWSELRALVRGAGGRSLAEHLRAERTAMVATAREQGAAGRLRAVSHQLSAGRR